MSASFDKELFESAFSARAATCRRTCVCGRQFYDAENLWGWEEGELERLQADPTAIPLPHAVSIIRFDDTEYVADCNCWVERATKIAAWLKAHDRQVTNWLNSRKQAELARAKQLPEVKL